jgi:hypothetical protein
MNAVMQKQATTQWLPMHEVQEQCNLTRHLLKKLMAEHGLKTRRGIDGRWKLVNIEAIKRAQGKFE